MGILGWLFGSRGPDEGESTSDLDALTEDLETGGSARRARAITDLARLLEHSVAGRAWDDSPEQPNDVELRTVALLTSVVRDKFVSDENLQAAARVLARSASSAALESVLTVARELVDYRQRSVLNVLFDSTDPRISDLFVELLGSSSSSSTNHRRLVEYFVNHTNPRAVEPLIAALAEASVGATAGFLTVASCLRRDLVMALANQKSERSIEGLVTAIHDPEGEVREAVVKGLADQRSSFAIGPLFQAAEDERFEVRYAAEKALRDLALLPEFRDHSRQYHRRHQGRVSEVVYKAAEWWNYVNSRDEHLLGLSRFPSFLLVDMLLACITEIATQSGKTTEFAVRELLSHMSDSVAIQIMEQRLSDPDLTKLRREALEEALKWIKSGK